MAALPDPDQFDITLIGPRPAFEFWADRLGPGIWPELQQKFGHALAIFEPADLPALQFEIGKPTTVSGKIAGLSIICASDLALAGKIDAIVTAPISKHALQIAGFNFPGHTEFLASLAGIDLPVMLMMTDKIRIAVATTHVPIKVVARLITSEKLLALLTVLHAELRQRFAINKPQIAVTALNPHAGESGKIGREEIDTIAVALAKARDAGIMASGPFPADSFFSYSADSKFDACLAMYHDQGLIPFKIFAAGKGVNYTCGLPYVRTSPDHGTAFDIAGRNGANFSSMLEAIRVAKSQRSIGRRS